ncbi:MAG: hypothetical protein KTR32_28185 [Granulosicoccus sp.]|nr:hypothetical protein [Granulosicoccus sp.]
MRKNAFVLLILVFQLSLVQRTHAEELNETQSQSKDIEIDEQQRLGVFRRTIVIVDDAQRIASERFGNFMGQIDGFFSNAGSDEDAVSNDSWARIRLDGIGRKREGFETDPSIKLRAVLPRTERKLKLLFSTEEGDTESSEEISDGTVTTGSASQNASLALRFMRTARDRANVNLDVGVRRRSGQIQTFGRINTRFQSPLADVWLFNAANSYVHFSKTGFEDRLSFDLRRRLNDQNSFYFRTYTEFNWRKNQKGSIIAQSVGLYWQFGTTKALAFETLAGYHTSLNSGISDRFQGHEVRLRWRHNIWRPWFFYEIWPSVSWPSTNSYNLTEGLLLRAEFIIGQR